MVKICRECKEPKDTENFYPNGKYFSSYCKPCCSKFSAVPKIVKVCNYCSKEYKAYKANQKYCSIQCNGNAIKKIDYHNNPEKYIRKVKNKRYKNLYGLTTEDVEKKVLDQENKCGICKEEFSERYCVDHDHLNGKIRLILCVKCNVGLGNFKENIEYLKSAIEYLEKFKED